MPEREAPPKPRDLLEQGFRMDELVSQLAGHEGSTLFLGSHTREEMVARFSACGILKRLDAMGFHPLFRIEPMRPEGQSVRVYDEAPEPERLLIEFKLRLSELVPVLRLATEAPLHPLRMLRLEWGLLQNPRASFTPARPRLPDQTHPGLGLSNEAGKFLDELAREHRCDGLLSFPQHYHNAVIYARRYVYFHPARQGWHEAMQRDLCERTLAERSFAVDVGCLILEPGGKPLAWEASEMVRPISSRLLEIVRSRFWRREAREARSSRRLRIDWERYDRRMTDRGKSTGR
jgi:hypothetical protein